MTSLGPASKSVERDGRGYRRRSPVDTAGRRRSGPCRRYRDQDHRHEPGPPSPSQRHPPRPGGRPHPAAPRRHPSCPGGRRPAAGLHHGPAALPRPRLLGLQLGPPELRVERVGPRLLQLGRPVGRGALRAPRVYLGVLPSILGLGALDALLTHRLASPDRGHLHRPPPAWGPQPGPPARTATLRPAAARTPQPPSPLRDPPYRPDTNE